MSETQYISPETGKPNPVSLREYLTMDRYEQRQFQHDLSKSEKKDLMMHAAREVWFLPLAKKREIQQEIVKKLEQRSNDKIGDKLELWQAKAYLKHIMLPEKQPIFFRKLRSKEPPFIRKFFGTVKSPYLISSVVS